MIIITNHNQKRIIQNEDRTKNLVYYNKSKYKKILNKKCQIKYAM